MSNERAKSFQRSSYQVHEAESIFQVLLIDYVKTAKEEFSKCLKLIQRDDRWLSISKFLNVSHLVEMFETHLDQISKNQYHSFHQFLASLPLLGFGSSFESLKPILFSSSNSEPFMTQMSPLELASSFSDFHQNWKNEAQINFVNMLRESKFLEFKVREVVLIAEGKYLEEVKQLESKDTNSAGHDQIHKERTGFQVKQNDFIIKFVVDKIGKDLKSVLEV